MTMLSITLPDGSVREVAPGTTPADIAAAIGPGLAKAAIAARVDGELRDLSRPLEHDARLALVNAQHDRVVASYNLLSAVGSLSPRALRLPTSIYDPMAHYQQVRDTWFGVRTPDGK